MPTALTPRPGASLPGRGSRPLPVPVVLLASLLALVAAACGSDPEPAAPAPTAQATAAAGEPDLQTATLASPEPVVVRDLPDAGAEEVTELAPTTALGSPRVLLVEETADGWVRVSIPERPNGRTGWVPASELVLEPVVGEVVVSLAERQLQLVLEGQLLAETAVAVGMPEHPTPTGRYYVTDRVTPPDPDGAYGEFALGLSAYSPTATDFAGGDGQVGIHGTNEPDSIGEAVSHGCVRVPDDVAALLERVPLGTPVTIR